MFRLLSFTATKPYTCHELPRVSWSEIILVKLCTTHYVTIKAIKSTGTSITLSQCPPCVISLSLNIIRLKEEEEALKHCCVNSHDHRFQLSKKKFSQHIKKSCWYSCVKSLQSADSFLRAMLSLTLVADTEIHLPLWSGMHISNLCILVFNVNTEAANTDK